MTRLLIASLIGALGATLLAWRLGGTLGAGVLAGFLSGAGMSGLGVLYQRHVLLTRPERIMQAVAVSFLAKLALLVGGGLSLRFVAEAAARADWRSFLVSFAAAVAVLLPLGALDAARSTRRALAENKA